MKVKATEYLVSGKHYTIRSADPSDAKALSDLRLLIDGETENMDRESGEAFIDVAGFEEIIHTDTMQPRNLFLVAMADNKIVGFSRCEGNTLKRLAHKVEFGVCVLRAYWGFAIGTNLLKESISWADWVGVSKITLTVLESNHKAIALYERMGFEVEGILKRDKLLSDGHYYNTIVMGRLSFDLST